MRPMTSLSPGAQEGATDLAGWHSDGEGDVEGERPGASLARDRCGEALGRGGQSCALHKGSITTLWGSGAGDVPFCFCIRGCGC